MLLLLFTLGCLVAAAINLWSAIRIYKSRDK